MHLASLRFAVVAVVALAASLPAQPSPRVTPAPPPLRDGRDDFAFLHGMWFAKYSRLERPLTGTPLMNRPPNHAGRMVVRPLAGGPAAIADYELSLNDTARARGAILLVYTPATRRWTLQHTNVDTGETDPPLVGYFAEAGRGALRGEFFGVREYEGRVVLVRQTWQLRGPNMAEWVQAFSADGGRRWEENTWTELTRMRDAGSDASPLERDSARDTTVHRESAHSPEERRRQLQFRGVVGEESPAAYCCYALELRRYDVPGGGATALMDLFERENELARQARGESPHAITWMENVALLRDVDRPDEYVWLRGFSGAFGEDPVAFHYGSIWAAHVRAVERAGITARAAFLLDPGYLVGGLVLGDRPVERVDPARTGLVVATVYTLRPGRGSGFESLFNYAVFPRIYEAGARPVARFTTGNRLQAALEVVQLVKPRQLTDNEVFVWFARFPDMAAYERYRTKLERDPVWRSRVLPQVEQQFAAPPQVWRMVPVGRSRPIL